MAIIQEILVRTRGRREVAELDRSTKRLGTTTAATDRSVKNFGASLRALAGATALLLVVRLMRQATNVAVEYGRALGNINAIAGLTQEELAAVSDVVDTITQAHGQRSQDVLRAYYDTLSAGFNDAAQANQLIEASARSAVAGNTTIANSTKVLTAILNSYGFEVEDVTRVQDVLQKTVENGVLTFEELSTSLGDVLPLAKSLNISLEELTGSSAALTLNGLSLNRATTAQRGIFNALIKPTTELQQIYRDLGVTTADQLIEQNGFSNSLKIITRLAADYGIELNKLFPRIEGLNGITALMNDNFVTLDRTINDNTESAGSLSDAYINAQTEALEFQKANARVETGLKDLGVALLPARTAMTDWTADIIDSVTELLKFENVLDQVLLSVSYFSAGVINVLNKITFGRFDELLEDLYMTIDEIRKRNNDLNDGLKDNTAETQKTLNNEKQVTTEKTKQSNTVDDIVEKAKENNRILELTKRTIEETNKEWEEFDDMIETEIRDNIRALEDDIKSVGDTVGESLTRGINEGKGAIETLRDTFLNVLNQLARDAISSGVSSILRGIFNPGENTSSGGILGNIGGLSGIFGGARRIFGFNQGGVVPNAPGSIPGRDSVPALLTPGEVVVNPARGQSVGDNVTVNITNRVETVLNDSDYLELTRRNDRQVDQILSQRRNY